ncbi:uncharacterized protein LOC131844041 [Achroia grisella]|uniref:uncharacterized protein LOC131844041 n=1 Tax=Achroia grisella TaxID=688607 RepID=UPI0027D32DA7|nr:uncharacterized protein LOC131844041 [Achroia grisella]
MNYGKKFDLWSLNSAPGQSLTYRSKMYGFDNNTIMSCIMMRYINHPEPQAMVNIEQINKMNIVPNNQKVTEKIHHSIYYIDHNNIFTTNCSGDYWIHLNDKNEILKTGRNHNYFLKTRMVTIHLTENDNNTILYCISFSCYVSRRERRICSREILNSFIFYSKTDTDVDKVSKFGRTIYFSGYNKNGRDTNAVTVYLSNGTIADNSNTDNKKEQILLICLVIVIILVVVLLIVIYFLVSKKKPRRQQPLPSDAVHYSVVYDHCTRQQR